MRFFLILTFLVSFNTVVFADFSVAHGALSSVQKLERVCGFSDAVFDYVYAQTAGHKPTYYGFSSGRAGSTKRFLLIFADASWVMTYEYTNFAASILDVSCVIGFGDKSQLQEAFDAESPAAWPTKRLEGYFGPIPPKDQSQAIVRKSWEI